MMIIPSPQNPRGIEQYKYVKSWDYGGKHEVNISQWGSLEFSPVFVDECFEDLPETCLKGQWATGRFSLISIVKVKSRGNVSPRHCWALFSLQVSISVCLKTF